MLVAFEEELSVLSELVEAPHFFVELWVDDQVEVIIDLLKLCYVFVLHLPPSCALTAWVLSLGKAYLINDDIVDIDLKLGKLNSESLSLIQR